MVISPLRRKVLRDLARLWAQALAIALVLAAGVATLILGSGAHDALTETRARYYADYRFADVFADLTRAPLALLDEIRAIDGVLAAEGRIQRLALLDMPGMAEPGSALLVSAPEGTTALNRLHLRAGRLPDPQSPTEAAVSEAFATAHGLSPGDRLSLLLNGQRRSFTITAIALSPEFIYAIGPGEMMPDPRRFAILWLPRAGLETALDLSGAMSNVLLRLAPGASLPDVIDRLDRLLAPHGGTGAIARADQLSHAFLDAEIDQIGAMVKVLPPIFLAVAAMLVNMTLGRLVTLEREQIGLLKAIGYSSRAVAQHYVEFVLAIALIGIAIGLVAGAWLGAGLAELYVRFFSFPFLIFSRDPQIYALATLITLAAAVAGAARAALAVARLPPAVAMAPPQPPLFRQGAGAGLARRLHLRQTEIMAARHLLRWPWRSLGSILGTAMATAILVASLWSFGSIDRMIEITFSRAERQDAQIVFASPRPPAATLAAARLPGVLVAEPFRAVPVRLSSGHLSRKVTLMGKPEAPRLSRLLAPDLRPLSPPTSGLILSEALAEALHLRPGDVVTVEVLDGRRPSLTLPVRALSLGYLGLTATIEIDSLHRLMGDGPRISGVNLQLDPVEAPAFFAAARAAPETGFITLLALTVQRFRDTLAENILIMVSVYVSLAGIIAVGVVYNSARIALSEQGRDLASLRVLGFTRAEVARILMVQIAAITLLAQPLGWAIGHGIGAGMAAAFSSDLYRVPFVLGPEVHATASLITCGAALLSALLIRRRIDRLDLIAVLKTRE